MYPSRQAACKQYATSASEASAMLRKCNRSRRCRRAYPSTILAVTEYAGAPELGTQLKSLGSRKRLNRELMEPNEQVVRTLPRN